MKSIKPYGMVSDIHCENWNAFSTVLETGVNSRLQALLDEIQRCANEVKAAGGNTIINAGDMFHRRGHLTPSVLNPVVDLHRDLIKQGFHIFILAGNHDLEGKASDRIGSAITALEGVGCVIVNDPVRGLSACANVVMIPWIQDIAELKETITGAAFATSGRLSDIDLVIHAPIDDVLVGIPAHGLDSSYLASLGFRRVFAGHYHHHKDFGNNVYSIGALAHHTWSDVKSKAGFLLVGDDVKWFKSHAPEFVDLSNAEDETEAELLVEGNYVRARVTTSKVQEINEMREWLTKSGAKGILIQTVKEPTKAREGTVSHSVKAGASIESSIDEYIKGQSFSHSERVRATCQSVLSLAGV